MEAELVKTLLEFGSLGGFAGFLVWQHLHLQKRLDSLTDSFKSEIRELEDRHEKAEDAIRIRYGELLSGLMKKSDGQIERVFKEVVSTLGEISNSLSESNRQANDLSNQVSTLNADLRSHIAEQRIRDMGRPGSSTD